MKIAIAGAGGMGSRFGLYLKQAGNDVTLIDSWKDNIEAIRKNGMVASVNGKEVIEHFDVYQPSEIPDEDMKQDLIVVLVKAPQLDAMMTALKPMIHKDTYVLCLMNGIGHEDTLKKYVPMEQILLGVTMWTAGMAGPGRPVLNGDGNVEIQNLKPEGEAIARKTVDVFAKAGLKAVYSENVKYSIWRKACVNGVVNGLCSILDCTMAEYGSIDESDEITKTIVSEFASVAAKEGVNLDQEKVVNHIIASFAPDQAGTHYPSMYQDLIKNHRKTEIDIINGAVVRKGKQYGIPVPYCTLITQLVHGKEKLLNCK